MPTSGNTDPNLGGVFITTRHIYEQLLELSHDVKSMVHKIDSTSDMSADHEARIRDLEKWKYATSASLITAIGSVTFQIVSFLNT
ncbi:hypothetical protein [Streptosporangium subroseum]|uniref:hypothetical protein n=1 Tax=Streptosporangium subroseum TaxID=106412 RepID=UPI00309268A0|nr:hypothetical protein OHB15_14100 [Streptosporangium subroseum]